MPCKNKATIRNNGSLSNRCTVRVDVKAVPIHVSQGRDVLAHHRPTRRLELDSGVDRSTFFGKSMPHLLTTRRLNGPVRSRFSVRFRHSRWFGPQQSRSGHKNHGSYKKHSQGNQRSAMRSDHDVSPWIEQAGRAVQPPARSAKPQRGRLHADGPDGFGNFEQGFAVTGHVALPQHVVVADFLAGPGESPIQQVHRRERPIHGGRQSLHKAHQRIVPQRVGELVSQHVAKPTSVRSVSSRFSGRITSGHRCQS